MDTTTWPALSVADVPDEPNHQAALDVLDRILGLRVERSEKARMLRHVAGSAMRMVGGLEEAAGSRAGAAEPQREMV